jgi:hypothetical protein
LQRLGVSDIFLILIYSLYRKTYPPILCNTGAQNGRKELIVPARIPFGG